MDIKTRTYNLGNCQLIEIPIVDKIPELDIAIKAAKEAGNAKF